MKTLCEPAPWEIWWVDVEYEDYPGVSKRRPVLVYQNEGNRLVLTLKMTTRPVRPDYPGEYEIIDYPGAGLKKATVIRCSKAIWLDKSDFQSRIGMLQPTDIMNVINIMKRFNA